MENKPLAEGDVVIHVPKGTAKHVRIEEADAKEGNAEITVRVSKSRKGARAPLLGVIVK